MHAEQLPLRPNVNSRFVINSGSQISLDKESDYVEKGFYFTYTLFIN